METSGEATPTPTPDETKQVEQPETWEEVFKGHVDSRPYGEGGRYLCNVECVVNGQKLCRDEEDVQIKLL